MKIAKKLLVVLGVVLLVLCVACIKGVVYMLFGFSTKTTDDIAYYRALSGETDGVDMIPIFGTEFDVPCAYDLPMLSELESAADYRFNYMAKKESIFQSHAYILIVSYDQEEYNRQKKLLNEEYIYQTDLIPGENVDLVPEFRLDRFAFRAVDSERDYAEGYPKSMFFIGTSDEENEIAYIYFYDQDLDFVAPSLPEFIRQETGWHEVK